MRRFPPMIEEHTESLVVHDATGQALGYFYFEEEPGRRSADIRFKATAGIGCFSSETARSRMTHTKACDHARRVLAPLHLSPCTSSTC